MSQAGRVGPVASPRWRGRKRRVGPVGPVWTRVDHMRRPTGDALRASRAASCIQIPFDLAVTSWISEHLHSPPPRPPKCHLGASAPKIPPSRVPQISFSSGVVCFFVWRTRWKAITQGGGAGAPAMPKIMVGPPSWPSHLTHLPADRHRAAVPPCRTIPHRNTFLPANRRTSTLYRPARHLFAVLHYPAGISRGATHLNLS
jgi:hypothetical protein